MLLSRSTIPVCMRFVLYLFVFFFLKKNKIIISFGRSFFQGDDKGEDGKGKKKVPVRVTELPIEARAGGLAQHELESAIEKEVMSRPRSTRLP